MSRSLREFSLVMILGASLLQGATVADAAPRRPTAEERRAEAEAKAQAQAALEEAREAWSSAIEKRPAIVTDEAGSGGEISEDLRAKLTGVEEQIFSNREWKQYWARQVATATALAEALTQAAAPEERIAGAQAWAAASQAEVESQEQLYGALQSQKDALEARLEQMIDVDDKTLKPPESIDEPTAYELRSMAIADLNYQIEVQIARQTSARDRITYLERQIEGESQTLEAQRASLTLAEQEVDIAKAQANLRQDGLSQSWQTVLSAARDRLKASVEAVSQNELLLSRLQVQRALLTSEAAFRERRLEALRVELEHAESPETLMEATKDTITTWLVNKAPRALAALLVIGILASIALRMVGRFAKTIMERSSAEGASAIQRRQTLVTILTGVLKAVVLIVAALLALEQVGVNTAPILGSVAILGLAISFGSQNLVRDVVNGFFILFEDWYSVGDFVTIGGEGGSVERITIRTTWLRHGGSGDLHAIPNGTISKVTNHTRDWGRAAVDVGVGYDSDLAHVGAVCTRIGEEMKADPEWGPKLLDTPSYFGLQSLDDSAMTVRMWTKVTPPVEKWGVKKEMMTRIKNEFDKEGIEIPFPQRVVHQVNSGPKGDS